ncbi:molybdopterin/thiamine biosynthesis adenylyltransferase [Pseudaminobacter salicylatoxidans]|uniref:Molybdopterin/thiamine biosynthesis adenylyltransferase n=1 Tax=Pseudaminobacter salicylatoxidans TaxID=93369 RepID=A0A316C4J0_PSESE|nr:HesA/MoeB/ThiF family protein [Pseudaminobacter salicylatoxidans]PWJ84620.1 molybdopterin/thiamine biosynthesis adenylyltransferase [Pseudaminobacter salicylatoxidans]
MSRYARQEILPQMGRERQERLRKSHILVVGAGGLGCPALQYLVGGGVGRITLVDPDKVERGNLHRQPLFTEGDIGRLKVEAARSRLVDLNPDVEVTAIAAALDPTLAAALMSRVDLALDCADSFAVTYTLSDSCKALAKPLVSASALGLSGYAGGFCGPAPSVRALFPGLPKTTATCATAGVLGPLVGTLGAMEAQMAIAILAGIEPSPLGQLVSIDMETFGFRSFRFDKAQEPAEIPFPFIGRQELLATDILVELRPIEEAPRSLRADALRLSVDDFPGCSTRLPHGPRVVLCCRSGLRAWRAAEALRPTWAGPIALIAAGEDQGR